MKNTNLTKKIMSQVAQEEESRLIGLLKVALPAVSVLFLAVCFTFHRTMTRLIDREFLGVFGDFKFGEEYLTDHLVECSGFVWREAEKEFLVALILAAVVLVIVVVRTDLFSFSRRFKQIKRYKS